MILEFEMKKKNEYRPFYYSKLKCKKEGGGMAYRYIPHISIHIELRTHQ